MDGVNFGQAEIQTLGPFKGYAFACGVAKIPRRLLGDGTYSSRFCNRPVDTLAILPPHPPNRDDAGSRLTWNGRLVR